MILHDIHLIGRETVRFLSSIVYLCQILRNKWALGSVLPEGVAESQDKGNR